MNEKLSITIFDAATGETVVREMTDEEIAALELNQSVEPSGQSDE